MEPSSAPERVTAAVTSESAPIPRSIRMPLWVKLLVFVVIIVGLTAAALWYFGGASGIVVAAFIAGISLGLLAAAYEYWIERPLRALSGWITTFRATSYRQLPFAPRLPNDELGDMGREVLAMGAHLTQTAARVQVLESQKAEVLSIISHQLRTPMNGITWGLESLLNPETSPEERAQLAEELHGGLRRMAAIIKNVIDSANIDEGRSGYTFEQSDLVGTIEQIVTDFRASAENKKVAVRFEHSAPEIMAQIDRQRFAHALSNVIGNAIEYTPQGGSVTITLRAQDTRAEIEVADTGIGMSDDDLKKLFTKFYRGKGAIHVSPNGSGLGLYVARNVFDAHDAQMTVRSREGLGTTVSITLPLAHSARQAMIV